MTEQPLDEAYKIIKDAIGAVQAVQHLAAEADTLRAEVARLRSALEWYGEQVHTFATDQTGKADEADVVLDLDRGSRARAALAHGEADQ